MHQWIGSLSHDLQGVIHLNMHLHFWFPDEGFPTQYRHRQCSFYRVCLTCEQRKPCARCKEKKCATEYTSSAWKARNADRRICRACATKSRGSWTCRTCRQVLPHQSFTAFRRRRPSGQDGTQVCDKCLQATCSHQTPLQQWQPSDCPAAVRENATKKSGTKSDVRLQPW